MSSNKADSKVILDTSFVIRLLNHEAELHDNVKGYYRFFLEHSYQLSVSTISIAEYCVRGKIDHLPWDVLRVIPFNLDHAKKAGEFAACLFDAREKGQFKTEDRRIIPNDVKIFAQAELERVRYFVTADTRSYNAVQILSQTIGVHFDHLDIHVPYTQHFGLLDI